MTHYLLVINYTDGSGPHTYTSEYKDLLSPLTDIATHHIKDFIRRGRTVVATRISEEPSGDIVWVPG